jgi:integrase
LVKKFKERSRKRYATTEEIQTIARLLEEEIDVHPAGVAFLYILMFSGSRPRAIERATWDQLKEFEIEGKPYGILTFSGKTTEKTGDEEKVVLPPLAMEAIQRLPRVKGYTITGIKMPRRLWRRVKEKAGCDDLWARDWRRTFATVGMTSGVDIGTIGELLNHRSTETTKIYAKVMEGHKFNAANKIANAMAELMKEKVG